MNLGLVATITVNGQVFPGWEAIEIIREYNAPWSYMKLRTAENTDGGASPAAFSIEVGDQAQGYLCGQKVIDGWVAGRQVVYDKLTHAIEILVASWPQSLDSGTVTAKPGQYRNQTIKQIVPSVAGNVGVNVQFGGDLSGTEISFKRVSEHVGERLSDFIARLCRWRNLHVTDDENGNLVLTRAKSGGAPIATLQEGRNIESARMVMNYQFAADPAIFVNQDIGSDASNGTDASQIAVTKSNPNYKGPPRSVTFLGDHIGSKAEAKMALSHALNEMNLWMFEIVATVPGWLMDNGQLWILQCFGKAANFAAAPITVWSPMLLPRDGGKIDNLFVKSVKHLQDNELGTRTEIACVLAWALGIDPAFADSNVGGTPYDASGQVIYGNDPSVGGTGRR